MRIVPPLAFVALILVWAWGPAWEVAVLSWLILASFGIWAVIGATRARRRG